MKIILFLITIFASIHFSNADFSYGARAGTGKMTNKITDKKTSYVETEVYADYGLNTFLSIRGSLLGRISDEHDYLGIQAAMPFFLDVQDLDIRTYMAPGYRLLSRGIHAPFAEAGVSYERAFGVGIAYRIIFYELAGSDFEDEGQLIFKINLNL